jgi:hypothetical protein
MSVMEVVWDLVVFLALVAVGLVGLVVLNLMARRSETTLTRRGRANRRWRISRTSS